ncbi:MAG: Rrf2 family transcriptional regulator [Candidatus Omnitrophica bacterium]|nr:Rrf2 family transcriptional regulator [Candidatus Omnitrophota bacterium]
MKISSRTRYGMRLMLALALNYGKGPSLLGDIANKEGISEKYLSQIIIPLKAQGLVNSFRGAKGGYVLSRSPSEMTLREIVEALEGELKLVDFEKESSIHYRLSIAVTSSIWQKINGDIFSTLENTTLKDLVKEYKNKEKKEIIYNI